MYRILYVLFIVAATLLFFGCTLRQEAPLQPCPPLLVPANAQILIDARAAPEGQRMVSFKTQQSSHATRTFYRDTLEQSGWAILLETEGGIRFGINDSSGYTTCKIDVVISEGINDKVTSVIVQEPGVDK